MNTAVRKNAPKGLSHLYTTARAAISARLRSLALASAPRLLIKIPAPAIPVWGEGAETFCAKRIMLMLQAEVRNPDGGAARRDLQTDSESEFHPQAAVALGRLLGYELKSAGRYCRFASVVLIQPAAGQADLKELLGETIRGSDEFFAMEEGAAAILMGETDREGAKTAALRYKSRCNGDLDLRFSIGSYPGDGNGPEELLAIARRRLGEALSREPGAIVGSG